MMWESIALKYRLLGLPLLCAACNVSTTDANESQPAAPTNQAPINQTQAAPDPSAAYAFQVVEGPGGKPWQPNQILQAQVALDRWGFSPGVIDGKDGMSFKAALRGFQEANKLPVTGDYDQKTAAALLEGEAKPTTWLVRIPDGFARGPFFDIPKGLNNQASLPALTYRNLLEKLAERFHTTPEVLTALGITPEQLLPGLWPTRVNTGAAFILVPLADEACVAAVVPDQAELARLSEQFELIGFYLFSPQTREPGRDAGARMFAPRYGIDEESATGMAAGPLACFLHDYLGVAGPRLLIEQGYLMQPPSASMITVDLQLAEGRIERLLAGGKAQVMSEITLELKSHKE